MLWPDDAKAIEKAIWDHDHPPAVTTAAKGGSGQTAGGGAAAQEGKPRRPNVYVSAILDMGGGNWTVWANGLRVTPDKQSPLFHVVAVHGDSVDIVVPGEGGGSFRLQPYQTWRSHEQDVVEGIVP
jgi:hypothetical protein